MKRLCSSFCVLLVLFNSIEYYGLILLAQKQLTQQVLQKIEANSGELGGTLILAIPLELPYSSDSDEYTRIDGQFAYHGEVYRMLKQKFYRSMLYVICIKDEQSTALRSVMADYTKLFSGHEAESTNTSFKLINSIAKDYLSRIIRLKPADKATPIVVYPEYSNLYGFSFDSSIFHPPQMG